MTKKHFSRSFNFLGPKSTYFFKIKVVFIFLLADHSTSASATTSASSSSLGHLPPKKRARPTESGSDKAAAASGTKKASSSKKAKIVRVVSSDSSSDSSSEEEIDDDEEEEIEEITTEGARANGIVSSNRGQSGVAAGPYHPNALKTEMNKVDVIVDGRPVAGMYQVVHHRIETISTTNAVVPRSVIEEQQVGIDLISRKSI